MTQDAPFTAREIKQLFADVDIKLNTQTIDINRQFGIQNTMLGEIRTQTIKTNGRVNRHSQILYTVAVVTFTIGLIKHSELLALLKGLYL